MDKQFCSECGNECVILNDERSTILICKTCNPTMFVSYSQKGCLIICNACFKPLDFTNRTFCTTSGHDLCSVCWAKCPSKCFHCSNSNSKSKKPK